MRIVTHFCQGIEAANDAIERSAVLSKTGPDQTRYFGLDDAAGNTQNSSEFSIKDVDTRKAEEERLPAERRQEHGPSTEGQR
jgi:hypothetical protein